MQLGRRKFSKEFKLQVINEIEAGKSVAQVTREYQVGSALIYRWLSESRNNPTKAFSGNGNAYKEQAKINELERMVGKLTMENEFLKKVLSQLRGAAK